MVITVKPQANPKQLENLTSWLVSMGAQLHCVQEEDATVIGLIGDTSGIDEQLVRSLEIVQSVERVREPFKKANRRFHPKNSIIHAGSASVGGESFTLIAGPCSIESEDQMCAVAEQVKASGATMLRGGAFKPRTSPYAFQGLRSEGIRLLLEAKKLTGLPIVTEMMDISQLPLFDEVDVIQVGARNMQNFEMLKELGHTDKPVLLKRGLSSTLEELLMSAEYVMQGGNENVILCERGIRTFETYTRNTLDVSAIPILKRLSHLPVIVDPSHATGKSELVRPMALAAVAAGADGLMIEVHNDPPHAMCDGPQSLTPEAFDSVVKAVGIMRKAFKEVN
jgi:3-deoxy-7-phosphoheptulonate synthase